MGKSGVKCYPSFNPDEMSVLWCDRESRGSSGGNWKVSSPFSHRQGSGSETSASTSPVYNATKVVHDFFPAVVWTAPSRSLPPPCRQNGILALQSAIILWVGGLRATEIGREKGGKSFWRTTGMGHDPTAACRHLNNPSRVCPWTVKSNFQ